MWLLGSSWIGLRITDCRGLRAGGVLFSPWEKRGGVGCIVGRFRVR